MKCIRCGEESTNKKICYSCLGKWTTMRSEIFDTLQNKYGKFSQENHSLFIKETKRLEKIWKKDKDKFIEEINKIK
jgi:hypothetical protein